MCPILSIELHMTKCTTSSIHLESKLKNTRHMFKHVTKIVHQNCHTSEPSVLSAPSVSYCWAHRIVALKTKFDWESALRSLAFRLGWKPLLPFPENSAQQKIKQTAALNRAFTTQMILQMNKNDSVEVQSSRIFLYIKTQSAVENSILLYSF